MSENGYLTLAGYPVVSLAHGLISSGGISIEFDIRSIPGVNWPGYCLYEDSPSASPASTNHSTSRPFNTRNKKKKVWEPFCLLLLFENGFLIVLVLGIFLESNKNLEEKCQQKYREKCGIWMFSA